MRGSQGIYFLDVVLIVHNERHNMANSFAWNYNGLENMSIFVVDGLTPQNPKNRFNVVSDKTDSMADT